MRCDCLGLSELKAAPSSGQFPPYTATCVLDHPCSCLFTPKTFGATRRQWPVISTDLWHRSLAASAASQPTISASSVQRLMMRCCFFLQSAVQKEKVRLASVRVKEDSALAAEVASVSGQQVPGAATLEELLRRPHVHYRQAIQRASLCCSTTVL